MKFCVYSNVFSNGKRDRKANSYEEACLWACSYCGEDDCKITKKSSRGGAKSGAGRSENSKETGKWSGEKTVAIRIPEKIAKNINTLSEAYDSLKILLEYFHSEVEKAKSESRTSTYPRTWNKAIKLLQEIDEILQSETHIV
ncbi:MAG: hypothetical protein PUP92_33600 [Rhizonema sp. PD38]|nr:hypothetical protein [Rhizonema sp. PD38]